MAVIATVQTQGAERAAAALGNMHDRISNPRPLLQILAERVRLQTLRRFESKTDPDGATWAPWAASTAMRRAGGTLMINTGQLRNSVNVIIGAREAEVGTSLHYAKYHHSGTRKMPKRQFLGVGPADIPPLQAAINAFIARALG